MLDGGWHFESRHGDALRVHRAEDMRDGAVLARGVEPLKANEHGASMIGIEQVLKLAHPPQVLVGRVSRGFSIGMLAMKSRVDVAQLHFTVRVDAEWIA
jgi:hypothetical protein